MAGHPLRSGLLLAVALAALGCAKQGPPPAVALVVAGEPAATTTIESAAKSTDLGVDLQVKRAPQAAAVTAAPPTTKIEERLALARADYASGELARVRSCAERLTDPTLVWSALEKQARALAARILVWRIACTSITRREAATESASTFAALGLELPPDVDAIPVEAHKILTAALQTAETTPRRPLGIRASEGAVNVTAKVTLDGRVACTTDCVVSVLPGDHAILVERPGSMPVSQVVRVAGDTPRTDATIKLEPAAPDVAARQWATLRATDPGLSDTNESVALLSQALRVRRLIYVEGDALGTGLRVRGALSLDGKIASRQEERGDGSRATKDVLRELLVRGGVVEDGSVYKKPLFWVTVAAVAIASSVATAYILYDPGSRTEVRTR